MCLHRPAVVGNIESGAGGGKTASRTKFWVRNFVEKSVRGLVCNKTWLRLNMVVSIPVLSAYMPARPPLNKRFSAFSVSDQFVEHKQR